MEVVVQVRIKLGLEPILEMLRRTVHGGYAMQIFDTISQRIRASPPLYLDTTSKWQCKPPRKTHAHRGGIATCFD